MQILWSTVVRAGRHPCEQTCCMVLFDAYSPTDTTLTLSCYHRPSPGFKKDLASGPSRRMFALCVPHRSFMVPNYPSTTKHHHACGNTNELCRTETERREREREREERERRERHTHTERERQSARERDDSYHQHFRYV